MKTDRKDVSFIVFSDDWGEHPSSCQHLFRHISENHKVLWINTIGMRNPTFSKRDFNKAIIKIRKMLTGKQAEAEKSKGRVTEINVCQPPMLPFSNFFLIRKFNKWSVKRFGLREIIKMNMSKPILVTTVPNSVDYIGLFGEKKVVYYCVDDFSEWPGLEKDLVIEMEKGLIQKSDLFVATSDNLYNKLSEEWKPTFLLSHGVDAAHFAKVSNAEHPLLKNIPGPRVGYFGLFDERSDQELIKGIAQRMKDVSFVIIGPVEVDVSRLRSLPNIHFTDSVRYCDLPKIVKGLKVMLLPYLVNDFTESISPLKLKEYIATGRPVVSTPIAEVLNLDGYITIVNTIDEWEGAIRDGIDGITVRKQNDIQEFVKEESWVKKAEQFIQICLNNRPV